MQPKKKKLTGQQKLGLEAYRDVAGIKGRLTEEGLFNGLHLEDWRIAFYDRMGNKNADAKNKAFNRVIKELSDLEYVENSDKIYYPAGESSNDAALEFAEMLSKAIYDAPHTGT